MAEINVQPKSSSAIWWIIGIIALAVILWFIFGWGWETEPGYTMLPDRSVPMAFVSELPFVSTT